MEESEKQLQESFIELLINQGYEYIDINNEDDLNSNFKKQLELFNHQKINDFESVLEYLLEGDSNLKYDKLRSGFEDIEFIDFSDFSSNIFQVTQEVTMEGKYTNRYDVTILINGLPLVQIELKKSGCDLKTAFRQIKRYDKHTYSGLFNYIQIFVISNKVNTRYFLNNSNFNYSFTYQWAENKDLESFTKSFLIKYNLINILSNYVFKDLISSQITLLRPYQISAINSVFRYIKEGQNAYIWMSPNTGKTLTSLRLAEMLKNNYKVIYITTNHLSKYPSSFVVKNNKKFLRTYKRKNLIISNIRSILSLKDKLDEIKDDKIIFILNEYEKYNKNYDPLLLKDKFKNSLFYCFTSAPIFDENKINDETTKYLFDNNAYSYTLKNAFQDNLNLELDVEYLNDNNISDDFNYSSKVRIKEISDYIAEIYNKKTLNKKFKSILVASSNTDLLHYYFNLKDSGLKIVPILRFESNDFYEDKSMLDLFEICINDYNKLFDADLEYQNKVDSTKYSQQMESDIIKRFNNGEIDLVVIDESMLTNKFKLNILGNLKNSLLNTVFMDCNLEYESLFELLALPNEVCCEDKTQGNIVIFRDLRKDIDNTVKLYSKDFPSEEYQLKNYDYYLKNYKSNLAEIARTTDFIKSYEKLSSNYHILERFREFNFKQTQIDEFNLYKDKYNTVKYKNQSSKKIIPEFNMQMIEEYKIDLKYIDNLEKDEIKHEDNIISQNVINNNNLEILNNNATSNELNIVNNTQNINFHIHVGSDTLNEEELNEKTVKEAIDVDVIDKPEEEVKFIENSQPQKQSVEIKKSLNLVNVSLIDDFSEIQTRNLKIEEKIEFSPAKECNRCGLRDESEALFCSRDAGIRLICEDDFSKVCPGCGMKFADDANYCDFHPNIKLIPIEKFTKTCPECGRMYDDHSNFCFKHPGIELVKKEDLVKYCPVCGAKFPSNYYQCPRCESKSLLEDIIKINIKDIEYFPNNDYNIKKHSNSFDAIDSFLTQENVDKMSYFTFNQKDFTNILDNIINIHHNILNKLIEDYEIDFESLSALDKLLLIAKAFVQVKYKSVGNDLGHFIFNNIYLDDRKPGAALEITTIIHELSHFLISEILEQIIMEVLDCEKTNVVEGFVCYSLIKNNFNRLLDEFCAHTVEGRYTAHGYQDYSSYNKILNEIAIKNEYPQSDVIISKNLGNTFAYHIKYIFDSIIDSSLKEEIFDEFENINEIKDNKGLNNETTKQYELEDFLELVKYILLNDLDDFSKKDFDELKECTLEFEKNNG